MSKKFSLTSLFSAIHDSVVHASHLARTTALDGFKSFFDPVLDGDGNPTGELIPKTLDLLLPRDDMGSIVTEKCSVPIFSLTPHSSMAIDTLKMSFEVDLHNVTDSGVVASPPSLFNNRRKQD